LPNTLTEIGYSAFNGTTALTTITIPKTVTKAGSDVFENSGLKTAIIENGAISVPNNLFSKATNLTQITIPNTVKKIGSMSFYGCTKLSSVTLPNTLTSIETSAFKNCQAMKSITIPKSVTYFGTTAVGYSDGRVIDGFIIYGYKNTKAQTYATKNKITFKALQEETVPVGDINNDGKIDVSDVTYLQMYLSGNSSYVIKNTKAADANGDGKIDVADVTKIQTIIAS
jgi:hypothetical protein